MKKRKLKKLLKRAERAMGEAYVVVGVLAMDCGRLDGKDVNRVLDNLAFYYDSKHRKVLPFENKVMQ